jgi:hypothetical protein
MHLMLALSLSLTSAVLSQQPAPGSPGSSSCIAIVLPSVQGVEGDASAFGASVREVFASFLRGPSMEVVLLDARLDSHAVDEARQKQCPRVLTVTITRKRSGGGMLGRVLGQAGASAAWGIPVGGVGAAVARGATVAATQAVAEMASSTKARDEMRLEYKLASLEGKAELAKSATAKAAADGEDLLTPMVETAAKAIVAVVK